MPWTVLAAIGHLFFGVHDYSEPPPAGAPGSIFKDCDGCPDMVVVPAGTFHIGSNHQRTHPSEFPERIVEFRKPFAVGRYEITFSEWGTCVADGGCGQYVPDDNGWGRGSRPVINVDLQDARNYVAWLSQKTGKRYRVISEAEWEYVARAGATGDLPWPTSNARDFANFGSDSGCCGRPVDGGDRWVFTAPVGSLKPNSFGLFDTIGNAAEIVDDCYTQGYADLPPDGSARVVGGCREYVVRGGSWRYSLEDLRVGLRWSSLAGRPGGFGFRVARDYQA